MNSMYKISAALYTVKAGALLYRWFKHGFTNVFFSASFQLYCTVLYCTAYVYVLWNLLSFKAEAHSDSLIPIIRFTKFIQYYTLYNLTYKILAHTQNNNYFSIDQKQTDETKPDSAKLIRVRWTKFLHHCMQ